MKKCCWIAKQYKKGWKLGFSVGNNPTKWLKSLYFYNKQEIICVLNKNIVFVEMGDK